LDEVIPEGHDERKRKLIADLEQISQLRGPFDIPPESREYSREWYHKVHENRPPHLNNERFGGYLVRKQTSLHKLAMVLSAAEGDSMIILPRHFAEADSMLTTLEKEMVMVFDKIGRTDSSRGQHEVLAALRTIGSAKINSLYKEVFRTLSYNDYRTALDSVIQAGFARVQGDTVYYVPPSA
jgi:hypothetical protein